MSYVTNAVSATPPTLTSASGAVMSARIAGEHSPLSSRSSSHRLRGWWSPQNHHRFNRDPRGWAEPPLPRPLVWFGCRYVFMRQSTEAVGIISHVSCMKVDSDRDVDSHLALQGAVLLHALVFSTLLTTSSISSHANQLIFKPELRSCGAANWIDWKFGP